MGKQLIRLGIVGAGYWACTAHLPSLKNVSGIALAAVSNRRREKAEAAAQLFGIEEVIDDWRDLVTRADIDAVLVTTPAYTHHEIVLAALATGKHVYCEGPLAMNGTEGRQMLDTARGAGVQHGYIRPRPYLYGGDRVQELLDGGIIGSVQSALLSWPGNRWLQDDPAHSWRVRADYTPPLVVIIPAAVVLALFGPVESVSGIVCRHNRLQNGKNVPPAPDHFAGLIRTASGADVTVQAGYTAQTPDSFGLQVFGSKGTLLWDWATQTIRLGSEGSETLEPVAFEPEVDLGKAWRFTREWLCAIQGEPVSAPDFSVGLAEVDLCDAAVESSKTGQRVPVAPITQP